MGFPNLDFWFLITSFLPGFGVKAMFFGSFGRTGKGRVFF